MGYLAIGDELLVPIVEKVNVTLQEKTASPSTSAQEITADSGYDGLSKITVNAVTSTIDSNIVAENIKKDVEILGVTGNYEGSGGSIVVIYYGYVAKAATSLSSTGVKVTVPVTGNYKISWTAWRSSSSYSMSTRLYVDGSAKDSERGTWSNTYGQNIIIDSFALTAGQEVEIYAKSASSSRYCVVSNLIIEKIS